MCWVTGTGPGAVLNGNRTCAHSHAHGSLTNVTGYCQGIMDGSCPGTCFVPVGESIRINWWMAINTNNLTNANTSECRFRIEVLQSDGSSPQDPQRILGGEAEIAFNQDNGGAGAGCTKGWVNSLGTHLNPGGSPGFLWKQGDNCGVTPTGDTVIAWPDTWAIRIDNIQGETCSEVKGVGFCVNYTELP